MRYGQTKDKLETFKVDTQDHLNSRYKRSIRFRDRSHDVEFTDEVSDIVIPERSDDSYHQVDSSTENRLDLISYKYYNDSELWWIIAYANGITDPFNIKTGTLLRIPSYQSLYGYKGVLA